MLSRTLLTHAHLPLKFWWEACDTDVYLINTLPSLILSSHSPYDNLFKTSHDFKRL